MSKKPKQKKLTKKDLKMLLGDACCANGHHSLIFVFLNNFYKDVQEKLGVSPRTMRRYRRQLRENMEKEGEREVERYKTANGYAKRIRDLLDQRGKLQEKVAELKMKKNGLLVGFILALIISLSAAFWRASS